MPLKSDLFDSDASSRMEREQARRRAEARARKAEEAKVEERVRSAQEAGRLEAERRKRDAEARAVLEAKKAAVHERRTGGVAWSGEFRAVARAANGDRVELPASALGELEQAGALEIGGQLTFELRMADAMEVVEDEEEPFRRVPKDATHAGVSAFVADDGCVGLPPKTMLSLARGDPAKARALESGATIRVTFVKLPVETKTSASLRPMASGFFHDEDSIELDLKLVLEREFKGRHTALTLGDWLAVDLGGEKTVRLRVEELEPCAALNVLNTDMDITVLPSEHVEAKAEEDRLTQQRKEKRLEDRRSRALAARQRLEQAQPSGEVRVQLRFADGHRAEGRFPGSAGASILSDLADAHGGERLDPDVASDWTLVSTYPRKSYSRADLETCVISDITGGQSSLALLVRQGDVEMEDPVEEKTMMSEAVVWESASSFAAAEKERAKDDFVEEQVSPQESIRTVSGAEKATLFRNLITKGLDHQVAARAAQVYAPQLTDLDAMGLLQQHSPALAVSLLDRYQGRMVRVVNALSDAQPDVVPQRKPPDVLQEIPPEDPKTIVAAMFQRLVSTGLPPNDAAAKAIVAAADPRLLEFRSHRAALKGMGFDDLDPRTLDLLQKHHGHIDDVVASLLASQSSS